MTPEAAQDLKAYFPDIFKDDDESNQSDDMKESQLRQVIREEIKHVVSEDYADDPGTAASGGGPGTEWFYIARLMNDLDMERREIKDIGQKKIGGETVHEFAANDIVFQIRKLQ